jgi:hypothetical protein
VLLQVVAPLAVVERLAADLRPGRSSSSISCSSAGVYWLLHFWHSGGTRRWATMPSSVAVTRNGSRPEVEQAGDRDGGVVRVQRAEDQVAGQRRLHGDLGRLLVADLADQHVSGS